MRGLHQVEDAVGCVLHAGTVARCKRDGGAAAAVRSTTWVKLKLSLQYRLGESQ